MKTPLYNRHVARGAKIAPFAGWDMPIEYEGILAEHQWTRSRTSVFDTCHMGEFSLRGPTALSDLERLLTQNVSSLEAGQARYGYLLRDDGGCLDDLTCYRISADHFWLVVNAGTREADAEWIRAHLSSRTQFEDLSPETAKLDIQGPRAKEDLEQALGESLPPLRYFRFKLLRLAGVPALISRTGYTGEFGYELYIPARAAVDIWDMLLKPGAIKPAGLGARDTLRLEMGYTLYGHELGPDRTPVAAARGQFIDVNKDFIGREACLRDLQQGCGRYLCGLQLASKRAARAGDDVVAGDQVIGKVTSGSLAPSLGVAVALAYVDDAYTAVGTKVEINARGTRLSAEVVKLPFYKNGSARRAA
ncbi:MAG: glycine cleavage system aminomethyltransferase GcvT [Kiritimatiellae bacterium]|nr:glycine cleavage system aminomethyltransferase GcvT [Kiritimatiellia bacterium]MDW8457961.1 glycine cleavage system aminomethyltransferase GcvT [Verrucomicrobiota bacterium]